MFGIRKIYGEIARKKIKYGKKIVRYASQKQLSDFDSKYRIVGITPSFFDDIVKLFRFSYLTAEPLLVASDLTFKYNPFLETVVVDSLAQGLSLVALCKKTGNIVGAAVNRGICPWDPERSRKFAEKVTCPKMAHILKFMATVMKAGNHWQIYNEFKIYEIAFIMTDKANERRGIAYNLVKRSIDVAKDSTYHVVKVHATNFYLQKSCRKAGMKLVAEIPYKSYEDKFGKKILLPPLPHASVQVFVSLPHASTKDGASKSSK